MIPLHDDNPTHTMPYIKIGASGRFIAGMLLIPLFKYRHIPLLPQR